MRSMLWPVFLGFISSSVACSAAERDLATVTYDGTKSAQVVRDGDTWTLTADRQSLTLTRAADGTLTLRRGNTTVATGKRSGDMLSLAAAESLFLKLELKADKTQVWTAADAAPVEFKAKADEIKARQGKTDLGKIKFYADTKKLKAKDTAGQEVAVMRGASKVVAAPGALLLPADVAMEKKLFLFLALIVLER